MKMSPCKSAPFSGLPGWSAGQEVSLGTVGLSGWKAVDALHAGTPSRLLVDPLSHLQSGLSVLPSGPIPSLSYARAMLAEAIKSKPRRLLVLGAGAASIPISVAHHLPDTEITAVDLEWAMEGISRSMFSAQPSIRFIHASAQSFLYSGGDEYDMVLVDVFSTDGLVPPDMVSEGFTAALRRRLSARGRLVWNVSFRRSPRWVASMADLMTTLAASRLPCTAHESPRYGAASNALLNHPSPFSPPPGWTPRKFSPFFHRPSVRHAASPFRWPSDRL